MMSDILLIDSDAKRRQAMSAALQKEGLRVDNATDLDDVSGNCDCVVIVNTRLDENWPAKAQTIPFVVLADGGSIPEAVQCIRKGANDYLALPIEANELVAAIERACTQNHPQSDRQSSQIQLIGDSPQMQGIKEAIVKAGPTSSPILIQGSSGTGKELVARALHACSGRSSAPLISLNCATVPHNFIESELFGVEKFDGEQKEHPGLIAAAHGGTLFLDEIAELPDSAQARLLRVLVSGSQPPDPTLSVGRPPVRKQGQIAPIGAIFMYIKIYLATRNRRGFPIRYSLCQQNSNVRP